MKGLSAILLLAAIPLAAAITQPVKVEGGQVAGVPGKDASITAFKGIPFAAPPVGDLRWRSPRPVVAWQGVKKADKFSASCIQNIVTERKPWTYEFMAHNEISEDCLYLNVFTPAKAASDKLPVYMWIHGGGNVEGSTAVPVYDGEGLARKGVVVVSVNYRLGIFGSFTHPELSQESEHKASGNYQIQDLVAALKWIQANIAAFGGDPAKVTIGGQSAGAGNTHSLTATPLAKGLFRGAIAESGSGVASLTSNNMRSLKDLEALGVKFAAAKGANSLADLRKLTSKQLTDPIPGVDTSSPMSNPFRFGSVVDGYVFPASLSEIFAQGKQNDVPTLTGGNKGEGGATPQPDVTAEKYQASAKQRYQELADEFLKLYPAANDAAAKTAQNESSWDSSHVSMYLWAVTRAKTAKTKAYTYFWDHTLPGPDAAKYGAFHTSEVPYVLNSLAHSDRPFTDADRKIADMMSSYWANFISTGNPNGKGLAVWPAVSEKPGFTMELGDKAAPIPVAGSKEKQTLFEKYYAKPRPQMGPM
jgi:para-nitrobenzyl esterase